jgi:hypothetical protein
MLSGFNFSRVPITLPEGNKVREIGLKFPFFFFFGCYIVCQPLCLAYVAHLQYEGCLEWIRTQRAAVENGRATDLAINPFA